jgi:hypothetical protein
MWFFLSSLEVCSDIQTSEPMTQFAAILSLGVAEHELGMGVLVRLV